MSSRMAGEKFPLRAGSVIFSRISKFHGEWGDEEGSVLVL